MHSSLTVLKTREFCSVIAARPGDFPASHDAARLASAVELDLRHTNSRPRPQLMDLDVLPAVKLRGFLVPTCCLDGRSRGYRRGLVGSGGLRRAALSHLGFGFTPRFDARH